MQKQNNSIYFEVKILVHTVVAITDQISPYKLLVNYTKNWELLIL